MWVIWNQKKNHITLLLNIWAFNKNPILLYHLYFREVYYNLRTVYEIFKLNNTNNNFVKFYLTSFYRVMSRSFLGLTEKKGLSIQQ